MADKLVSIPNNDTQSYPICRLQLMVEILDIQPNNPTNQNLIKVLKFVKQTNKKTLLQNFGD